MYSLLQRGASVCARSISNWFDLFACRSVMQYIDPGRCEVAIHQYTLVSLEVLLPSHPWHIKLLFEDGHLPGRLICYWLVCRYLVLKYHPLYFYYMQHTKWYLVLELQHRAGISSSCCSYHSVPAWSSSELPWEEIFWRGTEIWWIVCIGLESGFFWQVVS